MASFIEAIAAAGTVRLDNPATQVGGGQGPSLSDMARSALSSVGGLQQDFQSGVVPQAGPEAGARAIQPVSVPGEAAAGQPGMSGAVATLTQQIEASTRVQAQLTRFVAASSMSSSLGRNLNMFLRGQ